MTKNDIYNFIQRCVASSLIFVSMSAMSYEKVLSVGLQSHSGRWETGDANFDSQDQSGSGYHIGLRFYNELGEHNLFGAGIDVDQILNDRLTGFRALDYQRKFGERFRAGGFFGAASIDTGLPQNGYYMGVSASWYAVPKKLALTYELRHGNGLARDRFSQLDDPSGEKPDIFLDYTTSSFQMSWHF